MENFLEIITGPWREKAEYKAHRKLLDSLPEEYQFVYNAIEKYVWSVCMTDMINVLMNTLEAFAIAAEDGRSVLSVTGKDVSVFCDDLLKKFNAKTWIDKQREKLNEKINKRFGIENI